MKMYDFDDENIFRLSNRDGIYGGRGGYKDGILIDGEYWFIKYPKSTKSMYGNARQIDYTTSPLSEYIGSHIYAILGYDVHDTLLGIKNGRVVVACKDFCLIRGGLSEIRSIKNTYNSRLSEQLESYHESKSGDRVNLPELMFHLENNRQLKDIPGIKNHFWDMVVIDIFIDNNDRNNGNWGLVFNGQTYKIAPVYDNGNAFANKTSDERIREHLAKSDDLESIILDATMTAYEMDGHVLNARRILQMNIPELRDALERNVRKIEDHLDEIYTLIDQIPETYEGHLVCSSDRKTFYKEGLRIRYEKLLKEA